jgi:hypothetical protein
MGRGTEDRAQLDLFVAPRPVPAVARGPAPAIMDASAGDLAEIFDIEFDPAHLLGGA